MMFSKGLILLAVAGAALLVRADDVTSPWEPVGDTTTNYLGGFVSFDGTLTNAFPVAVVDANGDVVVEFSLKLNSYASTNDFPAAGVPSVHGAFALAGDKPYAYVRSGSGPSWEPLNIDDDGVAVHAAMPTNVSAKLVFIIDYSTDGLTRPAYAIRLYTNVTASATSYVDFFVGDLIPTAASEYYMDGQPEVSAAPFATAPTSVTLTGSGAIEADETLVGGLAYDSGSPSIPLAAEIYLCAWADREGVWVEFRTEDETGEGLIALFVKVGTGWKQLNFYVEDGAGGWVLANGLEPRGESATYLVRIEEGVLTPGNSYTFAVIDDTGKSHELQTPVAVSRFEAKSLKMESNAATLTFGSVAGKTYAIYWKADLAQAWPEVPAVTVLAQGLETLAHVPVAAPGRSGFFKIMMLADQ